MRILVLSFAFLLLFSCKSENTKDTAVDLMKYGMPIKVNIPEEAIIKSEDFGLMKDITIKKGDGYSIQILSSDAIEIDPKKIKQDELASAKRNPFFSKVVSEDDQGFIFEKTRIDSSLNYDFRYIKIQGDKKYLFQTGMIGKFDLDQVKKMYSSVQ